MSKLTYIFRFSVLPIFIIVLTIGALVLLVQAEVNGKRMSSFSALYLSVSSKSGNDLIISILIIFWSISAYYWGVATVFVGLRSFWSGMFRNKMFNHKEINTSSPLGFWIYVSSTVIMFVGYLLSKIIG